MKFLFLILICFSVLFQHATPREGMWLPLLLEKYNIEEMQQKGFRLTAEDIYSINHNSMKDAVVRIGGCTGVVVSDRGLVLTNYHCAYGSVQSHSSIDNDYLTDGFWALSADEELPNPGLSVTFLVRMEDVTEIVTREVNEGMSEGEMRDAIMVASGSIKKDAVAGTSYHAEVNSFYYGNEYYLFVYDTFEDVRLVGAPPSAIGKFGGDTDNWMWPRHTGDFAFYRIYANEDNRPVRFSDNNVVFQSPVHFPISTNGVEEGDFTMVYGFPGSTRQYLTSHAVRLITELINPHNIRLREIRMNIMEREMEFCDTVRIQYSSKFASVSNAWKRWQGENIGLARLDAVEKKKEIENRFSAWVHTSPRRIEVYGHIMPAFDSLYDKLQHYTLPRYYGHEALYSIEIIRFVNEFRILLEAYDPEYSEVEFERFSNIIRAGTENFFKDFSISVDKEIFSNMIREYYANIDRQFHPSFFTDIENKFDRDYDLYAEHVFSESIFTDKHDILELLDIPDDFKLEELMNDPLIQILDDIRLVYDEHVLVEYNNINDQLTSLYRPYVRGLRLMEPDSAYYPDANRTLRVSFGEVKGYSPRDAVNYKYYSTLQGVIEKSISGNPDYEIPGHLEELYHANDYGPWSADNEMRIGFIASNHTTGGNSGSPVINGDGHLIGINFDRAWEGTMSDIMFDPEKCRNISVDINYILFITDRYAGAGYLLDEMTIF